MPDIRFLLNSHFYQTLLGALEVKGDGGVIGMVEEFGVRSAATLLSGATIGPDQVFAKANLRMATSHGADIPSYYIYSRTKKGAWDKLQNRFLGVRFVIEGTIHYGWIRMTVGSSGRPLWASITGYAYETVSDQTIKAGQMTEEPVLQRQHQLPMLPPLARWPWVRQELRFGGLPPPATRNDH
jgi:hypothetical protein